MVAHTESLGSPPRPPCCGAQFCFVALPVYRTYLAEAPFSWLREMGFVVNKTGDTFHASLPSSLAGSANALLKEAAHPLAQLEGLRLDLSGTQVADAAPLAKLTNLRLLNLSHTRVADAFARQAHQPAIARPLGDERRRRRLACQAHQPAIARPLGDEGRRRRPARQAHQPAIAQPLEHAGRRRRLARQAHQPGRALPRGHAGRRRRPARQPHEPASARPHGARRSPTPRRSPTSPTCDGSTSWTRGCRRRAEPS